MRLVIRVKIIPKDESPAPARQRLGKGVLALMMIVIAALLCWVGISVFRSDSASAPVASETARNSTSMPAPAPAVTDGRLAPPAETAEATPLESEIQKPADAPTSAVHEVLPDVPRSARQTIRGTIKVSVRVTIDKNGSVLAATADNRGPSRYFERLAVEASKKWTFTPVASEARRTMLVRFDFTRAATTARATSLP